MLIKSIASPSGPYASTCGYCSPGSETTSSHRSAGLNAARLSCSVYQDMIDLGWRRSGTYCYKPNLMASCCPQYTIKLDALAFEASRSQRKLLNRWNQFVTASKEGGTPDVGQTIKGARPRASNSRKTAPFSLSFSIHASEIGFVDGKSSSSHTFEVILEPSSFTEEKYALFEKYQTTVHFDESTPSGFKRFLVDSPLLEEPIPYATPPPTHLPKNYGSYHQLYRLDGKLIAMGVIDILPACVSSVYFIYDETWKEFSLGKLSALRETSLAREMRETGAPGMQYLYMGYYIHSCQKMRYKGQYSPSYLIDPETYIWFPLSTCLPLLDKYRYACFSHPEHSLIDIPENEDEEHSGRTALKDEDIGQIFAITQAVRGKMVVEPINMTRHWDREEVRDVVQACVLSLGIQTAKQIAFLLWH